MKERIINNYGAEIKSICRGCAEGVKQKCKQTQKDHLQCALSYSELKDFKVEQVPESYEELKKLVSDNMKVFNKQVKKIEISTFMIEIHFKLQTFVFLHNGNIVEPNCLRPIVKRTPEQMWNIIKNLTEK